MRIEWQGTREIQGRRLITSVAVEVEGDSLISIERAHRAMRLTIKEFDEGVQDDPEPGPEPEADPA